MVLAELQNFYSIERDINRYLAGNNLKPDEIVVDLSGNFQNDRLEVECEIHSPYHDTVSHEYVMDLSGEVPPSEEFYLGVENLEEDLDDVRFT